jgi:hypothetical protein
MLNSSCLCGAIALRTTGTPGPVTAFDCTQCRKLSGFDIPEDDTDRTWTDHVRTYKGPGGGTRTFSGICGRKLWFRARSGAFSLKAGLRDRPTVNAMTSHIFRADKGDYDRIADGLLQYAAEGPD